MVVFWPNQYLYGMRYKIPIEIVELESENYHLMVRSVFEDGTNGNWIIDTGASKSVFDKNLAEYCLVSEDETEELYSAGISDEPMTTAMGYMKIFSLDRFKVENMKVALLDLTHINEVYAKAADLKICGLMGSDFLLEYNAVIDYRRKRLVLSK